MALHLNLYHEIQKQTLQRRRDPLKLGMYGVALLVLASLGYYFFRMAEVSEVIKEAGRLDTQWKITEPKAKDAAQREIDLTALQKLKETIVGRIDNRFFWAPFLQKIELAVPRNVQITSFRGSIDSGTRIGGLTISGIAAGAQPRKVAEDLRTTLINKCLHDCTDVTSNFSSLEDSDATVQLDGKTMNTALFALQFQFNVPIPGATPAPAPKK